MYIICNNNGGIFATFAKYFFIMLKYLKEYYRKREIGRKKCCKGTEFLNIKEVHSLGFVYEINSDNSVKELSLLYAFLKGKKIPFKGLVVVTKRGLFPTKAGRNGEKSVTVVPQELIKNELVVILPENLTWIGAVKSGFADEFFNGKFDLFVSFNGGNSFTLNSIAKKTEARMTIGMANEAGIEYTMVIEGTGKSILSPLEYISQTFHYLETIKTIAEEHADE